ncbi:MAG: YiiX/YebB-like N1pC/P60 family cysteine hydrolase [Chitinophagales bacterium]
MKKAIIILGFLGVTVFGGIYAKRKFYDPKYRLENAKTEVTKLTDQDEIKNGDLIFQTSISGQSNAIQLATKSKYSHCGLIYKDGNDFYVFEAIQPVKWTPLDKWIARGHDGKYVIKRLKNADEVLTPATLTKMKQAGDQFNGKNYDLNLSGQTTKFIALNLFGKSTKGRQELKLVNLRNLAALT